MKELLEKHFALQDEVLATPTTERGIFRERIEEYCHELNDMSPGMTPKERRFAWQSIAFWVVIFRQITGLELNIVPRPSAKQTRDLDKTPSKGPRSLFAKSKKRLQRAPIFFHNKRRLIETEFGPRGEVGEVGFRPALDLRQYIEVERIGFGVEIEFAKHVVLELSGEIDGYVYGTDFPTGQTGRVSLRRNPYRRSHWDVAPDELLGFTIQIGSYYAKQSALLPSQGLPASPRRKLVDIFA